MQDHCVEMDHRARLVRSSDFRHFQYIFGMDEANMRDLRALAPSDSTAQIEMLGSYDPEGKSVIQDPYYASEHAVFAMAPAVSLQVVWLKHQLQSTLNCSEESLNWNFQLIRSDVLVPGTLHAVKWSKLLNNLKLQPITVKFRKNTGPNCRDIE
ncbi:low molecular weight phosphotyrosine protein phosphatase 1-like [Haemaphysalis longicornis]